MALGWTAVKKVFFLFNFLQCALSSHKMKIVSLPQRVTLHVSFFLKDININTILHSWNCTPLYIYLLLELQSNPANKFQISHFGCQIDAASHDWRGKSRISRPLPILKNLITAKETLRILPPDPQSCSSGARTTDCPPEVFPQRPRACCSPSTENQGEICGDSKRWTAVTSRGLCALSQEHSYF